MNTNKLTLAAIAAATGVTLTAAVPEISGVTMTQDASRRVTISYTLSEAPAVVTMDVQTNYTENGTTKWASIGGENIQHVTGDVWQKIETGARTIHWRPDLSWPDHKIADGGVRAVVTAWALDNTPDYMVVDVSAAAQPNTQKYYPSAEFLPGGILANETYRKTALVMRKIMAKDVLWTMGSTTLETQRQSNKEATHQVTLTNNYYIGVFPVTQSQWDLIQPSRLAPSYFYNVTDRAMRPVEYVCYNEIRNTVSTSSSSDTVAANTAYYWPADPNPSSFLGKLRTRTGLDFDLPSEAQWEFAARAGNGDTKWGDGTGILNADKDTNLDLLGRYKFDGGHVQDGSSYSNPAQTCGATNGTAIVGSYAPNDWGLYDVHGNVWEWCLDWYEDNINAHGGKVNINPDAPAKTLSGANGQYRVFKGGSWGDPAGSSRPAYHHGWQAQLRTKWYGFRVACTAGLR